MRELKFRVWDKLRLKYREPLESLGQCILICLGFKSEVCIPKEDLVLQQFTGLLDKNDKPIYEGDLVNYTCLAGEHDYQKETNQEVFFEDGMFLFGRNDLFCMADSNFLKQSLEVVGNIFENKELVK